jgi:hypothetical protein
MCDITIAAENAVFGSTQVKDAMNGFYHGLLRKVNTQRARRMFFTGDPVGAREACVPAWPTRWSRRASCRSRRCAWPGRSPSTTPS